MNLFSFSLSSAVIATLFVTASASAQCNAVELIHGANKYNKLVCDGYAASATKNPHKALDLFLEASTRPLFEIPNTLLFGQIAKAYAEVGDFPKAETYLQYDNLSLLWEIGIVRCNEEETGLVQDGQPLTSAEAKHVTNVVCGAAFDDFTDFSDRSVEDFVPVANAILQHRKLRRAIEIMRQRQYPHSTTPASPQ